MAAATLVFSVLDAMLLRPLPFDGAERISFLSDLERRGGGEPNLISPARYADLKRETRSFEAVGAFYGENMNLTALPSGPTEAPERIAGVRYVPGLLEALGVKPYLGRFPSADEERAQGPKAAVVTYSFWRQRLGATPAALNQTLHLSGAVYTIVGVLPEGFRFPSASANLFIPAQLYGGLSEQRAARFLRVIVRRKPGIALDAAKAETDQLINALGQRYGKDESEYTIGFEDARDFFVGKNTRRSIWMLSGAVALLLLIAAVNAANLMLARGMGRQRDQALQLALGAKPGRLIRETLLEGLVLSTIAGAFGMIFTLWGLDAVRGVWKTLPTFREVNVDPRVAFFTLLVATGAGIAASLGPGILAARRDAIETLRGTHSGGSIGGRGNWRRFLAGTQIAFSLALLAGAFALGNNLDRLLQANRGFRSSGLLTFQVTLPWEVPFEEQTAFFRELRLRFADNPLISRVAYADGMPYDGTSVSGFRAAGKQKYSLRQVRVSPDYFAVLGMNLKRGRGIEERDRKDTPLVAVLNESAARLLFPGADAVGKTIFSPYGQKEIPLEVVGVVADTQDNAQLGKGAAIYASFQIANWPSPSFFVEGRGAGTPALIANLRKTLKEFRPSQALHSVQPMETYLSNQVAEPRLNFFLVRLFAIGAGLLVFFGIYGIVSWYVEERRAEIGVRMALGAQAFQILGMVLRQGLIPVAGGIAVGAAMSWNFGQTAGIAYAVLAIVSLSAVALFLPALRALRIEPREALRGD